jgi:hypothetical protein
MNNIHTKKKVLVSLHGINTRGTWQKDLCPFVSEKGWKYYPLDYGHFAVCKFLLPFTHRYKLEWFRKAINHINAENPNALPSIIVHSFGSLILARALENYHDLKFDKVILTGSIIPIDYPWNKKITSGQVSYVRNLFGKADIWSNLAAKIPWLKTGNSGAKGFDDILSNSQVENIGYAFDHGGAHASDVYKSRVIPLLEDLSIPSNAPITNYLTYVDPLPAACWTAVTYVRQFVRRFQNSIINNDFHYRGDDPDNLQHLETPPRGLIIVIPDLPNGANQAARLEFEKKKEFKRISFSERARSGLLARDGEYEYVYDIPSALESFNVYREECGNSETSKTAIKYFEDILRDALDLEFSALECPPKVKRISEILSEESISNV